SLTLTGQLGDVMEESARAALSWLRMHAKEYNIDPDFFTKAEMHVHVPSGAIPKDGPSAGGTMATAMASQLTGRPVRGGGAMTGEITPSGRGRPGARRKHTVAGARPPDRRREREGARGTTRRDQRSDPAEAEREERERGSHARAATGAHDPPGVDDRRGARARAALGIERHASRSAEALASDRPGRRATAQLIVVHSARYRIDIGPHVYPTEKYRLICERLLQ